MLCRCVCEMCVLRNPSIQIKWKSLSPSVAVSPTLCDCDSMDYSPLESLEFSRQEYWSGLPFPSLGDLPHPGTEPRSPAWQTASTIWATRQVQIKCCFCLGPVTLICAASTLMTSKEQYAPLLDPLANCVQNPLPLSTDERLEILKTILTKKEK